MTRADVVIAGGGPAGSSTAIGLARAGYAVTIVERSQTVRRKVCGEYLNVGAVRMLDELGAGARVRELASPLQGVRIVPSAAPAANLSFVGTALALARDALDGALLDVATGLGVRVVRARVEDLTRDGAGNVDGVVVRDAAGEEQRIAARVVVGADGCGSVVARKLGVARESRGPRRFAIGGHYRGLGDLGSHVEMYVGGGAYFAINPLGADVANVMVVVREAQLAAWSGALDRGMQGEAATLAGGSRSIAHAERIGDRLSVGPLAFDVSVAAHAGAFLVGDAAGFLNPFTGQGVYLALRSGAHAARAIDASLREPARAGAVAAAFARERARDLAQRRRLSQLVGMLIDVPVLARRSTERLARRPRVARRLIGALSGAADPRLSALSLGQLLL